MRPRIRTIKPELWQSRDFMALPMVGKVAFFCLISHADDDGRLKTDHEHSAQAWLHLPADEVRVAFAALENRHMIVVYDVAGEPYVQVENWREHQKVDHPTPSRYPAPPKRRSREGSRNLANGRESSPGIVSDRIGSEGIVPEHGSPPSDDLAVFGEWAASTGRTGLKFTESRRRAIRMRRKEGYPQDDLLDAVRGWQNDPWAERPQQNELTILLRNGGQLEKFRDLWRNGKPAVLSGGRMGRAIAAGREWQGIADDLKEAGL